MCDRVEGALKPISALTDTALALDLLYEVVGLLYEGYVSIKVPMLIELTHIHTSLEAQQQQKCVYCHV